MKYYKRKLLLFLAGLFLILCGVIAAGYPLVADLLFSQRAKAEIKDYRQAVAQEESGKLQDMYAEAQKYNEALYKGQAVSVADYGDLLAVTDAIGYLEIPKLNVYLPIYHGLEEETLQKGIGHIPETSLPVGGASTHCVLSGHSGLPAARLLTGLDEMEKGDRFYLHVLDETLAYEVNQVTIVLPEETEQIRIAEGKDYVTLQTCTPYGVNTHRLLVRGERTSYMPQAVGVRAIQEEKTEETGIPIQMVLWIVTVAVALLVLLVAVVIFIKEVIAK